MGLKLKGPAAAAPNQGSSSHSLGPSQTNFHSHIPADTSSVSNSNKRKLPAALALSQKKARYDLSEKTTNPQHSTPVPRKRKSVTFATDTKDEATTPSAKWTPATTSRQLDQVSSPTPTKKKKKSKKTKKKAPDRPLKPAPSPNLDSALSYLHTWKDDRKVWKFNKNHQTTLLRHIFTHPDPSTSSSTFVPSADIPTLIEYIRDLKGFVRTRLREAAFEIKQKDTMPYSPTNTGFPEGIEDVAARQSEYDDIIRSFLSQPQTPGLSNPRFSFSFSEPDFFRTHPDTNAFITRRVVKRMRAEMVLDAIESEDSDASNASRSTHLTESSAAGSRGHERPTADKRLKLNNGTQQRVKRKRKLRTTEIENDTSSDDTSSDSDSDSEADSEGKNNEINEDTDSVEEKDESSPSNESEDNTSSSSSTSDEDERDEDRSEDEEPTIEHGSMDILKVKKPRDGELGEKAESSSTDSSSESSEVDSESTSGDSEDEQDDDDEEEEDTEENDTNAHTIAVSRIHQPIDTSESSESSDNE